ncbi:MAG: hypothetical protein MUE60_10610 [Candidatus Eisenbacteria bacterium]|jgi:epoxyqueuosine reductase|nr:hypothetical protein [Candidatus Eisenbacteria bacterium]
MTREALLQQLAAHGYQGRVVSVRRLEDLREGLDCLHRQGQFDAAFYRARLTGFTFAPPEGMPEARSLIIVAYRDPPVRFTFDWRGTPVPVMVPPTYLHSSAKDRAVEQTLGQLLIPAGYRVEPTRVPRKLLAVCSGLASYGRNNLAYVAGMGSFHRLAVVCSDLPCDEDDWPGPRMMSRCARCEACVPGCPAGAIDPDRFLIHAERCITFWNEEPSQVSFPAWMQPSWHNCLVGCMHCQTVCPENREFLERVQQGAVFSEDETRLLLQGTPPADLPGALSDKLRGHDLFDVVDLMPRNLGVLLQQEQAQSA